MKSLIENYYIIVNIVTESNRYGLDVMVGCKLNSSQAKRFVVHIKYFYKQSNHWAAKGHSNTLG